MTYVVVVFGPSRLTRTPSPPFSFCGCQYEYPKIRQNRTDHQSSVTNEIRCNPWPSARRVIPGLFVRIRGFFDASRGWLPFFASFSTTRDTRHLSLIASFLLWFDHHASTVDDRVPRVQQDLLFPPRTVRHSRYCSRSISIRDDAAIVVAIVGGAAGIVAPDPNLCYVPILHRTPGVLIFQQAVPNPHATAIRLVVPLVSGFVAPPFRYRIGLPVVPSFPGGSEALHRCHAEYVPILYSVLLSLLSLYTYACCAALCVAAPHRDYFFFACDRKETHAWIL
mmetsp:Transcript_74368/g.151021  ORF Transcript_74368/g.151021 Transcript_74368/m.151021 type:complete len:280 (+) Transcript_74368:71-910(+)